MNVELFVPQVDLNMGFDAILLFAIVIFSITVHEYMHGYVAFRLGDLTPVQENRLSLNPLRHIDLFGTILLPLIMITLWGKALGYAKPVPINPYNFKNPKKDMMWVAIAGPSSNLALALILGILAKLSSPLPYLSEILLSATIINVILAFFNLLPVPPLDGSKILAGLLPYKLSYKYLRLEPLGIILMLFLVFTNFFQGFIFSLEKMTLFCLGAR